MANERPRGINVGQAAAAAIPALRAGDGSDAPLLNFAYPQGTNPGEYRFTPGFPFAFATSAESRRSCSATAHFVPVPRIASGAGRMLRTSTR